MFFIALAVSAIGAAISGGVSYSIAQKQAAAQKEVAKKQKLMTNASTKLETYSNVQDTMASYTFEGLKEYNTKAAKFASTNNIESSSSQMSTRAYEAGKPVEPLE